MKRIIKVIIIVILVLGLYTCVHHHKQKTTLAQKTLETVESKPLVATLYYSGIVQPRKTIVVTSPADGVIDDMSFHYGDAVKTGQMLFSISSEKFQTDYKTALMQYIKAKTDFMNSQSLMKESEFLHKNQLISDDDFKAKQTGFYNAQLGLIQAKDALSHLLKQLDVHGMDPYDLKIEDIDKITKMLHAQENTQLLHLLSPDEGVVLLPNKGDGSDGEVKKIVKGDQIKQGDVLAVIGNVNGLTIKINVSEFNINQLKLGQKVQVTGAAFPDFVLQGEIAALDRQGQASQGGVPAFPVEIVVTSLTPDEQAQIHIGMSAKVAIQTGGLDEITVPIQAVFQKNGESFVKVQNDKDGKIHDIAVKTGQTTIDSVVIVSNLSAGEKIVVPH
ncbi:MAG: efflux RND transporter periplasmic adaptor subunit [Gammaproteobacteria bacterium]